MHFISHRGNLNGINKEKENSIDYILNTLSENFEVEIDIWKINDNYFLGHDDPIYEVELKLLEIYKDKLWIHCKNLESLYDLKDSDFNCFWHQNDDFTLTSKNNYIWTFPGKKLTPNSICVLPEITNYTEIELKNCAGICSDIIEFYHNIYKVF